jgi:hypothetical protein
LRLQGSTRVSPSQGLEAGIAPRTGRPARFFPPLEIQSCEEHGRLSVVPPAAALCPAFGVTLEWTPTPSSWFVKKWKFFLGAGSAARD